MPGPMNPLSRGHRADPQRIQPSEKHSLKNGIEYAKEQLKGNLLLSLESSDNLMIDWQRMKSILDPTFPWKNIKGLMK